MDDISDAMSRNTANTFSTEQMLESLGGKDFNFDLSDVKTT